MPYALCPMPYAHEYLIFRSKGYILMKNVSQSRGIVFRKILLILGGELLAIPFLPNQEAVGFPATNASEYIDNHPI